MHTSTSTPRSAAASSVETISGSDISSFSTGSCLRAPWMIGASAGSEPGLQTRSSPDEGATGALAKSASKTAPMAATSTGSVSSTTKSRSDT
jgi:hypothetical protein